MKVFHPCLKQVQTVAVILIVYNTNELKNKDYLIDNMISDRQKKLSNIEIERIRLNEKLTLLTKGISDEILKTRKQIHDLYEDSTYYKQNLAVENIFIEILDKPLINISNSYFQRYFMTSTNSIP